MYIHPRVGLAALGQIKGLHHGYEWRIRFDGLEWEKCISNIFQDRNPLLAPLVTDLCVKWYSALARPPNQWKDGILLFQAQM